jgi:hypothetical protein
MLGVGLKYVFCPFTPTKRKRLRLACSRAQRSPASVFSFSSLGQWKIKVAKPYNKIHFEDALKFILNLKLGEVEASTLHFAHVIEAYVICVTNSTLMRAPLSALLSG